MLVLMTPIVMHADVDCGDNDDAGDDVSDGCMVVMLVSMIVMYDDDVDAGDVGDDDDDDN